MVNYVRADLDDMMLDVLDNDTVTNLDWAKRMIAIIATMPELIMRQTTKDTWQKRRQMPNM